MAYETLLYDVADHIATVTLNRPDSYNALNRPMYRELQDVLKQIGRDPDVRVVILTGAGKGFCSGADLTEFDLSQEKIEVGDFLRAGLNRIVMGMRELEKPIICAINGVAAGAGASLTLASDFRIASDQASYVFAAFVNLGIIPDAGATYFLPQLVGVSRAYELVLTADASSRLSAQQALADGLVNRVVPHDQLITEATQFAERLARLAPRAVGMTKRAIYRNANRTLAEAVEYEAQLQDGAFRTRDFREGVSAFMEKRAPQFTGE